MVIKDLCKKKKKIFSDEEIKRLEYQKAMGEFLMVISFINLFSLIFLSDIISHDIIGLKILSTMFATLLACSGIFSSVTVYQIRVSQKLKNELDKDCKEGNEPKDLQ